MLNDAFAEGRLTRQEWDERAGELASSATYAELDRLTADLPAAHPQPPQYGQPTNGLAIASLACGIGQLVAGFPAGIAAIILGHQARRRIRVTGEQGDGMARAGLILGYVGTTVFVLLALLIVLLGVASTRHI